MHVDISHRRFIVLEKILLTNWQEIIKDNPTFLFHLFRRLGLWSLPPIRPLMVSLSVLVSRLRPLLVGITSLYRQLGPLL